MKNKKGFTLIELLAVIVVLGIIMLIAVTSVSSVITKSKLSGFKSSSGMLEKAASNYVNSNNIIITDGSTTTLLYSDLKSSGFMNQIVDPTSKSECTNSRVYVTNVSGKYTYTGALVCDNYMDVDAYNLVNNYDFSNNTTGWTGTNSTLSASSNVLSVTGNGGSSFTTTNNPSTTTYVQSDKAYIYARVRVTNNVASAMRLKLWGSTSGAIETLIVNTPTQNQWYSMSVVYTLPTGSGILTSSIYASYADAATANGKVLQIDGTKGVYVFDLTAIYGAGNEPTSTQMDKIMNNMGKM